MAQNKQREVESQSLQAFEKFIGKLDGIISGDSRNSQPLSEREIKIEDVVKNGKEWIQQLKSEVGRSGEQQVMHIPEQRRMEDKNIQGRRSGEQQVMHTPEQRRMEDKNIQGRRSGEQQVMHTPEQRRMEDKNIQGPSTVAKKSDKDALQVEGKHQDLLSLQEELRTCKNDLKTKDREIESLIKRMARFSEMLTKRDQRNVEDTLSLNRPSIVEQDFRELKSEERVDALEVIRKQYKKAIDVSPERLSCIIFEAIFEYMFELRNSMVDGCKEMTKFVVSLGPWFGRYALTQRLQEKEAVLKIPISSCGSGPDYPREVVDSLLLAIKESAPEFVVDKFTSDDVLKQIETRCQLKAPEKRCSKEFSWDMLLRDVVDYVKTLIKLTWRMVTQVPPLKLEYHMATFDSQYHKMVGSDHEGEDGKEHEKPVCYSWPGLVDGGGRVIHVGEVTPLHCDLG